MMYVSWKEKKKEKNVLCIVVDVKESWIHMLFYHDQVYFTFCDYNNIGHYL